MKQDKIEDYITLALEEASFEDILERYDLSPQDVFTMLYEAGMIEEETLEADCDVYYK